MTVTVLGVEIGQLVLVAGGVSSAVLATVTYRVGTRGRRHR